MKRTIAFLVILLAGCYSSATGTGRLDGGTDPVRDSHTGEEPAVDLAPDTGPDSTTDAGHDVSRDTGLEPTPCDRDADGWESPECGGLDCNDADPTIHPGAYDICEDGIDQDCDGMDAIEGIRGEVITLLDYYHFGPSLYTMLVWTGTRYAFIWRLHSGEGIFVDWISASGKGVSEEVRIRQYENAYAMAWNGSVFGTVWSRDVDGEDQHDLYYQTLDASGVPVMDEVRITHHGSVAVDGGTYCGPVLTWADGSFAVVWMDERRGPYQLLFTRVDTSGEKLLGDIQITSGTPEADGGMSLAWTGSELGFAWNKAIGAVLQTRLFFGRVDTEGNQLMEPVQLYRAP